MLSSTRTSSQLVSDTKATIEEICIGRLLSLKAIITFVAKIKSKYDVDGTIDWQTIVGHFADPKAAKKKFTKNGGGERGDQESSGENYSKGKTAEASPAQKKSTKSKVSGAAPAVQKPTVKSTPKKPAKKIEQAIDDSEEPAATTMVDPFFITTDGSSYLSTAVIDRTQADGPDDDLNRRSRRANRLNTYSAGPKANVNNKSTPQLKSFGGSSRNNARKDVPEKADVDVHPSWSAKRKQKSIPAFQGKKIKFDGSDDKPPTSNTKRPIDAEESTKLHPSWVAKQKLKPVITEFKGSKITFD